MGWVLWSHPESFKRADNALVLVCRKGGRQLLGPRNKNDKEMKIKEKWALSQCVQPR